MSVKQPILYFFAAPLPFQVRSINDCWYFVFLAPNGRFDFAIPADEQLQIKESLNLSVEQTEALTIFLNAVNES